MFQWTSHFKSTSHKRKKSKVHWSKRKLQWRWGQLTEMKRLKSCTWPGTTGQRRLLYNTCDVKRHHSQLSNNSKTRLFVLQVRRTKQPEHYLFFLIPKKNPFSSQATQRNSCQIFVPQKIPESKISNQKNPSIITWKWPVPPVGLWLRLFQKYETISQAKTYFRYNVRKPNHRCRKKKDDGLMKRTLPQSAFSKTLALNETS